MSHPPSTPHQSYRKDIESCNRTVAERFHMTFRLYKTIKALTQLAGVAAGVFAIQQGADPLQAFAIVGVIISGGEAMEYIIGAGTSAGTNAGSQSSDSSD